MNTLLDLIDEKTKVLKTTEVMEYLGVSKHKLNKLIKDGEIRVKKNEKNSNQYCSHHQPHLSAYPVSVFHTQNSPHPHLANLFFILYQNSPIHQRHF